MHACPTYKPYHVDVFELLKEFAVPVLQSVGLVNDAHTPLDVAQLTLRRKDDLVGRDDDIELVRTRYDAALQRVIKELEMMCCSGSTSGFVCLGNKPNTQIILLCGLQSPHQMHGQGHHTH